MCVCVEGVWGECIGKDNSLTQLGPGAQRPSFLNPGRKGAAGGRPGARLQEDRGGRCQASVVARRSVGERAAWGLASLCVVVWGSKWKERTHALHRFPSVLGSVICSLFSEQPVVKRMMQET